MLCDFHLSFKDLSSVPSTQLTVSKALALGDPAAPYSDSSFVHQMGLIMAVTSWGC